MRCTVRWGEGVRFCFVMFYWLLVTVSGIIRAMVLWLYNAARRLTCGTRCGGVESAFLLCYVVLCYAVL